MSDKTDNKQSPDDPEVPENVRVTRKELPPDHKRVLTREERERFDKARQKLWEYWNND